MKGPRTKVTLLAGGVGGAKMAEGFAALDDVALTVIGNVGDDEWFHGLLVSPDIDTVTYTLAGLIDRQQGWGVHDEGHRALSALDTLGQDTWMTLGDRDLGLHIYRTMRLRRGDRPSDIARDVAQSFGVAARIVLPTDDPVRTRVQTAGGWLGFQEYFVREQCAPEVIGLAYQGLETAKPTPEALAAIAEADLVVVAPSNPLVSIAPILDISSIRDAVRSAGAPVVAVSPLIAGRTVKGPADRMMTGLGMRADAAGVAEFYGDLVDLLVIDAADEHLVPDAEKHVRSVACRPILMKTTDDKAELARELISLAPKAETREPTHA